MPKVKISEFDIDPANNTDINSINIAEGCAPSGINNAIRQLMADLKEFQTGAASDPLTVGGVATFTAGSASAPAITTAGDTNTGIFFPAADTIAFSEGGTEAMRLDSSGNLGLGVTPSAWNSAFKALQIGLSGSVNNNGGGTGTTRVGNNYVYDSVGFKYLYSTAATNYAQNSNGNHEWYTAPSGTQGNAITFTQAMTLDASGNLGVGTSSPSSRLNVVSGTATGAAFGSNQYIRLDGSNGASYTAAVATTGNQTSGYYFSTNNAYEGGMDYEGTSRFMTFRTANAERMRIDSSGNLLVGKTSTDAAFAGTLFGGNGSYLFGTRSNDPYINANRTGSDGRIANWYRGGVDVGNISVTGSATSYNTSSDYRLKDNQAPLTGSGAFIDALQPKTWTWTADGSVGTGFIAHEVQEVSPNSVVGEKDAVETYVDEDGVEQTRPKYQSMEYGSAEFIANIIAELQDLRKRVSALENK